LIEAKGFVIRLILFPAPDRLMEEKDLRRKKYRNQKGKAKHAQKYSVSTVDNSENYVFFWRDGLVY
jgi:hypothetical protein